MRPAAVGPQGSAAPVLLLVEDDRQLTQLLTDLLVDEGYRVDVARDGQAGLHHGLTRRYDVLVLDRGLPAVEGVDLLRRLRSSGVRTPALILTARSNVADRVEGLDAGAQDYLAKPFEVPELLARLRALVRRPGEQAQSLPVGQRRLDVANRRVVEAGNKAGEVELSGRECALLRVLATSPERVFTREQLLASVFDDADSPGAVDTYVHYLRRKLGREVVRTVHGLGYRLGNG